MRPGFHFSDETPCVLAVAITVMMVPMAMIVMTMHPDADASADGAYMRANANTIADMGTHTDRPDMHVSADRIGARSRGASQGQCQSQRNQDFHD